MRTLKKSSTFLLQLLLIASSSLCIATSHSQTHFRSTDQESFTSIVISQKGLDFVKDLLITQAISSIIPLRLPKIEKTVEIPVIGNVHMFLSNITIYSINVLSSYVNPGESGVAIVASGATCNLSMNWSYKYSTWVLVPIEISDKGSASVQVEGMDVGLTLGLENQKGTLKLSLMDSGCYVKDISIKLDGGASWLYQGLQKALDSSQVATHRLAPRPLNRGLSGLPEVGRPEADRRRRERIWSRGRRRRRKTKKKNRRYCQKKEGRRKEKNI
ncbi:hypothetical protein ACOSQ4_003118 [Xanthoceras sorbifolium]